MQFADSGKKIRDLIADIQQFTTPEQELQ